MRTIKKPINNSNADGNVFVDRQVRIRLIGKRL